MTIMKLLSISAVSSAVLLGFLIYSPYLLNIEPQSYQMSLPFLEGPLEANELLTKTQRLFNGRIKGPESFAIHNGIIYTGTEDGFVIRIDNEYQFTKLVQFGRKCDGPWAMDICGRPLGMRATKDRLYVVDAYYGLHSINIETGKSSELLSGKQDVSGKDLRFLDHLDIDEQRGKIYMTQMSTKWGLREYLYSFMEWENSGRVISLDLKTGKIEVILDKLGSPNGIQLSHDRNALLISETFKWRILRYDLKGPRKGQTSTFATLPGEVDNIVANNRGGYWVAVVSAHNASQPSLGDRLTSYPTVRKIMTRVIYGVGSVLEWVAGFSSELGLDHIAYNVKSGSFLMSSMIERCMMVELDLEGNILRSLQSSDKRFCFFSEALEHDGYLYLGSFANPYLGRLKL